MRRFFILTEDSRQRGSHSVVPIYPVLGPNCFNSTQVLKGKLVPDDCLMAGPIMEKSGKKVDLVGNPMGWPIVSPGMLIVFNEFATGMIQSLRFNAVDSSGAPALTDYRVMNVLNCLDEVVDLDQSVTSRHKFGDKETLNIITPVFRVSRIPPTTHVFRAKESLFSLIVSQEFAKAIQKAKLKGCFFAETGSA